MKLHLQTYKAPRFSVKPKKGKGGLFHIVYAIRHKRTGSYYIGSHTDKEADCIWKTYFTSSKLIHKLTEIEGKDAFFCQLKMFFDCRSDANLHEKFLIKINSPEQFPLLLNKAYAELKGNQTKIQQWPESNYRGEAIRINPKSPILLEEYRCSRFPEILLKWPFSSK